MQEEHEDGELGGDEAQDAVWATTVCQQGLSHGAPRFPSCLELLFAS